MDWARDYELLKSGGLSNEARNSLHRRNEDIDEDDPFGEPMAADIDPGVEDVLQEEESQGTPLEQLTRHWMNERHAPDILAAQEDLLTNLLDHLRRQVRLNVFLKKLVILTHCMSWPVRSGAAPSRRSFHVGGRTYANYAGSNWNRACQIYREIVCAYTTF